MTTLKVNAIEPEGGTTNLTIGMTGQNVAIGADSIRANTFKDAGGNTLFTSNGSGTLSSINSGFPGSQVLLSTTTVSSAVANISFTSGITSTYKEYVFEFFTIHPATDVQPFGFQVNASGQSGFNETITSTFWDVDHTEGDAAQVPVYEAGDDQAQGSAYQRLARGVGNLNDECMAGELHLFNPASTTYVKHFYSRVVEYMGSSRIIDNFVAGYINTTAAITEIDFKFASGNIDAGKIKMYGIK